MLAVEPPTSSTHFHHPNPGGRKPLQPRNMIMDNNNNNESKSKHQAANMNDSNKENWDPSIQLIDASLAEELTAVKQKLERLKLDRDKTHNMLQERGRFLDLHMAQLHHRGELQKYLEIEVDRLYRLKHLKLACTRMSPIRSLREKEKEKKMKGSQLEQTCSGTEKSGESKEEMVDENSTSESPTKTGESGSSTPESSASVASKPTATSKLLPIRLGLRLESAMEA